MVELLSTHTGLVASLSEARRAIKGNAVSVNKENVGNEALIVDALHLLHGRYLMLENGKKSKLLVKVLS